MVSRVKCAHLTYVFLASSYSVYWKCLRVIHSPWVLGFEPVEKSIFVEGRSSSAVALIPLDVCDGVWVFHHLDKTRFIPSRQAAIGDHSVSRGAQKQKKIGRFSIIGSQTMLDSFRRHLCIFYLQSSIVKHTVSSGASRERRYFTSNYKPKVQPFCLPQNIH